VYDSVCMDGWKDPTFRHGFVSKSATCALPAEFCERGIKRFVRELGECPESVRNQIVDSLIEKIDGYDWRVDAVEKPSFVMPDIIYDVIKKRDPTNRVPLDLTVRSVPD